jgi:hypothetical protein
MVPGVKWSHYGGNHFTCVYVGKILKKNLLKNHEAQNVQVYTEDSRHNAKSNLHIRGLRDSMGPQLGKLYLICSYMGKILKKYLKNHSNLNGSFWT